jgi:hypothetical protein
MKNADIKGPRLPARRKRGLDFDATFPRRVWLLLAKMWLEKPRCRMLR